MALHDSRFQESMMEYYVMCQLKHPNVVTCFGVTTSNNYFNLFLELMTGRFELLRCAWRFSCLKEVAIEVLQKKMCWILFLNLRKNLWNNQELNNKMTKTSQWHYRAKEFIYLFIYSHFIYSLQQLIILQYNIVKILAFAIVFVKLIKINLNSIKERT